MRGVVDVQATDLRHEPEDEVDDHEHAELGHDRPRSPVEDRVMGPGPGENHAHEPEDRARGADRRRMREQEAPRRATDGGEDIEQQEQSLSPDRFEHRPDDPQRIEIQGKVQVAPVDERHGDEAVELAMLDPERVEQQRIRQGR